ncbi:distribution and morphology protein 35 [Tricharina praecox]|uniref:distribution and morphology protein 35 n=1 Tax=Tricharina praecox TaxID=43433 RepID=UPI00221EC594|nr:distribution and morphology protein 35 [Tricharina praecox]KAI5858014.1 distribution and morphology protein 35 [Tricharina praecox]
MSASLAPECSERKERYDTCFINWYSEKYLRGSTEPSKECEELFKEYKTCLNKALKEKGIYNMIEDARKTSPNGGGGGVRA